MENCSRENFVENDLGEDLDLTAVEFDNWFFFQFFIINSPIDFIQTKKRDIRDK